VGLKEIDNLLTTGIDETPNGDGGIEMTLSEYFEKKKGRGVIATADTEGKVGIAVYAKPHFINEKTVAFIMADRLMHKNLESNPHAAYLFVEDGNKYVGKRLYLTKIKEEQDIELINRIRRREVCPVDEGYKKGLRFLVYFKIGKVLPLVGSKDKP
jgi:hypothetical protein